MNRVHGVRRKTETSEFGVGFEEGDEWTLPMCNDGIPADRDISQCQLLQMRPAAIDKTSGVGWE